MPKITSSDDSALDELCSRLCELALGMDHDRGWPQQQLDLCGRAGVYEWFMPHAWGGQGWSDAVVSWCVGPDAVQRARERGWKNVRELDQRMNHDACLV